MFVLKRDGRKETVLFDKITSRIKKLCYGLDDRCVRPAARARATSRAGARAHGGRGSEGWFDAAPL